MNRLRNCRLDRSSGPALGVGPWLLLSVILGGTPALQLYPDQFPLFSTMGNEGASGMAYLQQRWSPFGVSVDEDGRVEYEVTIDVADLPAVAGESYHVWLTTPTLESTVDLGTVGRTGRIIGRTKWEQLMVVVSREPAGRIAAEDERWNGPVVLRGFSAGARVKPLGSHSLFQQTPM